MDYSMEALQRRLKSHFENLAQQRTVLAERQPIFALEHGLQDEEITELNTSIRQYLAEDLQPFNAHYLVWIVYSAEIGYDYDGYEYWPSFEAKTPGWKSEYRGWLRRAFVTFNEAFGGAQPVGPWADQFSIISWPVTHAVLPRDLQQQLAQILYELRNSFSAELFEDPHRLGELVALRSATTSARFRNLVQAPALVGHIAAALLFQGMDEVRPLILPATLSRIGKDVDRESRGREWLRRAQQVAENQSRFRGVLVRNSSFRFAGTDEARTEVARLGIEPRLVLRPTTDESHWDALLEIPDLSRLNHRFPHLNRILAGSRCRVAGSDGPPRARGYFLHRKQRVLMSRWPQKDEVLLQFESPDTQLDFLFRTECLLRPNTEWLFKLSSDGLAYELRDRLARPGRSYLLVGTRPVTPSGLLNQITVTCRGLFGVRLELPLVLSREWESALAELNIAVAKSLEIWPAGLAATSWDGEGHGEWLSSETPVFAFRSDHLLGNVSVILDESELSLTLDLDRVVQGEPTFIELPRLSLGPHYLRVTANNDNDPNRSLVGDLNIEIRDYEGKPLVPGNTIAGPLQVEIDPATPSLEEFWQGKVAVAVRGPAGRQVNCRIRFFNRGNELPSLEVSLPSVELPKPDADWVRLFETGLGAAIKDAPNLYDQAQACEIRFSSGELGVFTLRCERKHASLQWWLENGNFGFCLHLNDAADSGSPTVEHFHFESPTVGEPLALATQYQVGQEGGLYVATLGNFKTAIIVPPWVQNAEDVDPEPSLQSHTLERTQIQELLSFAELWGTASLPGESIARTRQRTVVRRLTLQLWTALGGSNWGNCEEEFAHGELGLSELRTMILKGRTQYSNLQEGQLFPRNILKKLAAKPLKDLRDEFVSFSATHRLLPPHTSPRGDPLRSFQQPIVVQYTQTSTWLAEFALRAASDPPGIRSWAGDYTGHGLGILESLPVLARVARFLVLAVDQIRTQELGLSPTAGEVFAGWGWSS